MAEYVVEKAVPGDFVAIAALDRVGWRENREGEFIPDGEHSWRIWCEHALTLVVRAEGGGVAGVILAFPCISGPYCLHKVLVAGEWRGRGIATRLFEALLIEIDALGVGCFLTVDPVNLHAIGLYEKMGFKRVELVQGFYRPSEDRWIMLRQPGQKP